MYVCANTCERHVEAPDPVHQLACMVLKVQTRHASNPHTSCGGGPLWAQAAFRQHGGSVAAEGTAFRQHGGSVAAEGTAFRQHRGGFQAVLCKPKQGGAACQVDSASAHGTQEKETSRTSQLT